MTDPAIDRGARRRRAVGYNETTTARVLSNRAYYGHVRNDNSAYWWWRWNSTESASGAARRRGADGGSSPTRRSHPVVVMAAILLLLSALVLGVLRGNHRKRSLGEEGWTWDRNNYVVRKEGDGSQQVEDQLKLDDDETKEGGRRNLLIVQEAGSRPLADIMGVTARVNRAYAKQWGYDYMGFTGSPMGTKLWHATFNKAHILRTLLEEKDEASRQPKSTAPEYDAVLMLDVDAIITDIDYNVLDMFPKDRLLGIADSSSDGSWKLSGGLIFWNLNHPEIRTLSKLWMETVEASLKDPMADGLNLMSSVIINAYADDAERLVHSIGKPLADYFAGRVVKYFRKPPEARRKIDWLENDSELIASALQQTADAVCIRYYPKCEVV